MSLYLFFLKLSGYLEANMLLGGSVGCAGIARNVSMEEPSFKHCVMRSIDWGRVREERSGEYT